MLHGLVRDWNCRGDLFVDRRSLVCAMADAMKVSGTEHNDRDP